MLIKLKSFRTAKETINKMKRQPTERIFNPLLVASFVISKIYWVGQKIHLGFSIRCMGKPEWTFWPTQYKIIALMQLNILKNHPIEKWAVGFPGGAVVENLPANAGDTGSSPGLARSHMPRSNWAHEPQLLSLCVWSLCSATREAVIVKRPTHRDEEWPPLATTRESPRTETKTQHSQK